MKAEAVFNDAGYGAFDLLRFKNFDTLGVDLAGKKILELGSGIGNHTAFLLSKNPALIVSVEGRKENYDLLKAKFAHEPRVRPDLVDLETDFSFSEEFDLVYNYGLLYHLANPFACLNTIANVSHTDMVLETCIETTAGVNNINEAGHQSQSLSGVGSRPNIDELLALLRRNYQTVTVPPQPEHRWFDIEGGHELKRRVIVCRARKPRIARVFSRIASVFGR